MACNHGEWTVCANCLPHASLPPSAGTPEPEHECASCGETRDRHKLDGTCPHPGEFVPSAPPAERGEPGLTLAERAFVAGMEWAANERGITPQRAYAAARDWLAAHPAERTRGSHLHHTPQVAEGERT